MLTRRQVGVLAADRRVLLSCVSCYELLTVHFQSKPGPFGVQSLAVNRSGFQSQ